MIALTAATFALAPRFTTYFLGISGTAPYVYSVIPGNAGGTINSSTGLYTAPTTTGFDLVQVTDALGHTATATMLIGTPVELFCDVIMREMNLDQSQVYLFNEKYDVPNDSRLYIAVGVFNPKAFGNSNKMDANGNSFQVVNMMTTLSVNVMSRDRSAMDRREEVILALNSDYARSQCEINNFYISSIPVSLVNLSEADGDAVLNRFNISVNIQYLVMKTKAVPYFDTFSTVGVTTEP